MNSLNDVMDQQESESGLLNSVLGLASGDLRLSRYRPEWDTCFQRERTDILGCIGPLVIRVEHVGSTAILGMIAKPILDVGIAVEDFDRARVCVPLLEKLGYEFRGEHGIPRRHYFLRGDPRTHHVHMLEEHGKQWASLICFRDKLRASPDLVDQYSELKLQLKHQVGTDRESYQKGKSDFVHSVVR